MRDRRGRGGDGRSLLIGRFSLALLVGWAFAIAASSFCPLLVLGIWWRQLTRAGAAAGIVVGGGACLAAIVATMAGAATSGWAPCCWDSRRSGRCRSRSA